jgi:hypothetical protein
MRKPLAVVAVAAVALFVVGCSSSTGPSAADALDDYWIDGYYSYYTTEQRDLSWESCAVYVRSGGQDGTAVSGLSVTCNGQPLSFDQAGYFADITDIEPGEEVTFRVSDGRSSVELTLEVPGAATDLVLQEGAWDFSSPSGTHTLVWQNPTTVADSILVVVAGQVAHPIMVYAYSERLAGTASQTVLSNADMSGFDSVSLISCAVTQGTQGSFAGHSGGSEIWARAGVIREWDM